ncbi:hypothetical protein ASF18_02060 [Methylobacterium sp. Leaf89]|nr:hypothetical protein ASF18_02060 [Methylobacterium sp. Leaf89]
MAARAGWLGADSGIEGSDMRWSPGRSSGAEGRSSKPRTAPHAMGHTVEPDAPLQPIRAGPGRYFAATGRTDQVAQ